MKHTVIKIALALSLLASPMYAGIQEDLEAELLRVRLQPNTTQIVEGPTIRQGDFSSRVYYLTTRLAELYPGVIINNTLDESHVRVIKKFQRENGLFPDGLVGKKTLAVLNQGKAKKIASLKFSLEQWADRDLGDKSVIVNIPAFELVANEGDDEAFRSKTIVGRKNAKTPIMITEAFSLKYNPEWNVPPGIARSYKRKLENGNEQYLIDHGVRIVRNEAGEVVRFYQPPGIDSALGLLKFELDNDQFIYLHDTNERHIYGRDYRAASSGCVRVQNYEELAEFMSGNSIDKIQSKINTSKTFWEKMPERVPVHIVYLLAWPDSNGKIQYYDDIYGYLTQ